METNCIEEQANEFIVENKMPDDGAIRILSIGRFCKTKNFDNIPEIFRKIVDFGFNEKWYYYCIFGGRRSVDT